jgi:hypothetical protein
MPLTVYLSRKAQWKRWIKLPFSEIEGMIGNDLPASAHKNPEWWTNNNASPVVPKVLFCLCGFWCFLGCKKRSCQAIEDFSWFSVHLWFIGVLGVSLFVLLMSERGGFGCFRRFQPKMV